MTIQQFKHNLLGVTYFIGSHSVDFYVILSQVYTIRMHVYYVLN